MEKLKLKRPLNAESNLLPNLEEIEAKINEMIEYYSVTQGINYEPEDYDK